MVEEKPVAANAVILALLVSGVFALALFIPQLLASRYSPQFGPYSLQNRNSMMDGSTGSQMGGGMMGENSMMPYQSYNNITQGDGMMGGMPGWETMGPRMMEGMPMMKGMMGYYSQTPIPLAHDEVMTIAGEYLASLDDTQLKIDEFEEYSHNFYVSIVEESTGRGAVEIIIDRFNGGLQLEPQSMMWNGKYGMMGGGSQEGEMTITSDNALKIAQDFLDNVFPGTEADEIVTFYGYYTIMTTLNDEHYGMLSVNGYSGDIWYHTWHGMFISEVEIDASTH